MKYYIGLIEKETDSLYGIWFPDLGGCTSAASTLDGLIRHAPEAVKLYCDDVLSDGETLPVPSLLQDLIQSEEIRIALQNGAVTHLVQFKQQKMLKAA